MTTLNQLNDAGGLLVLTLQGTATAEFGDSTQTIDVRSMLTWAFEVPNLGQMDAHLERFGLTSRGVLDGPDAIGSLGMESDDPGCACLRIAPDLESAELSFAFETDVFYDAMEANQEMTLWSDDVESVAYHRFRCTGRGDIRFDGDRWRFDGQLDWHLGDSAVDLSTRPLLKALHLTAAAARVDLVAPSTPNTRGIGVHRLEIQPIGFRIDENDPNHSAQTAATQIARAQEIWGNCCLELVFRPLCEIDDEERKTTTAISQVAKYSEFDHAVRAYFVDADIANGGARTFGPGMGNGRIVLSDRNDSNDNLLAHEIGHVLKGDHPGTTGDLWAGDTGTVLVVGDPNPAVNTVANCKRARNGGLAWLRRPCVDHPFP